MGCLNCGKKLVQTTGKREKQFCNSTCRSGYWQRQKTKEKNQEELPYRKFKGVSITSADSKSINIYENKNGMQVVSTRTPPPDSKIISKKEMPKGLSLQEQIDWKIANT